MTMDPKDKPAEVFADDAAYLDAEFIWLKGHVHLMDLQRRRAEAMAGDGNFNAHTTRVGEVDKVMTQELARQLDMAKTATEAIRKKLDARVETHRQDGAFQLGMDILCDRYQLKPEERLILLALTVPAVSGALADDILSSMSPYGGSLQVQELVGLLNPKKTADWMAYRSMFMASSPLISNGLVAVDYRSTEASPGTIWLADASLTSKAFGIITGDPSMMDAGDSNDPEELH